MEQLRDYFHSYFLSPGQHAEQHNLKLEGFHSAVDRYDRFLEQNPDLVE